MAEAGLSGRVLQDAGGRAHTEHLTMMLKALPHTAKKIAASISVQQKSQWSQERLGRAPLTRLRANSTIDEVRAVVQAYIIKRYKPFLSKDFVLSRLRRLSFEPIQFEFPLARTLAADSDHGHKHFLACLVWACTDKLLRQGEDSGGRGRVFEYLDYRRRYNACRNGVSIAALAQQADSWVDPDCSLETAVDQFRNIYGSEHWTWDVLNLPAMGSA